jgi:hypothetical protein
MIKLLKRLSCILWNKILVTISTSEFLHNSYLQGLLKELTYKSYELQETVTRLASLILLLAITPMHSILFLQVISKKVRYLIKFEPAGNEQINNYLHAGWSIPSLN